MSLHDPHLWAFPVAVTLGIFIIAPNTEYLPYIDDISLSPVELFELFDWLGFLVYPPFFSPVSSLMRLPASVTPSNYNIPLFCTDCDIFWPFSRRTFFGLWFHFYLFFFFVSFSTYPLVLSPGWGDLLFFFSFQAYVLHVIFWIMNVTNDLRLLFLSDGCWPVELAWCFPLHYIYSVSLLIRFLPGILHIPCQ